MKKYFVLFNLIFAFVLLPGQDEDKPTWSTKWNQGVEIKRSDDKFKFKLGGRVQFDIMNIYEDDSLSKAFGSKNGAEFRRLRWYTSGTLYGNINFKLQFDFSNGDAGVKDAYLEVTKIPWIGNFRAGHFKQPFGLEMQTSSNHMLFMERGLTNAFTPERDIGLMIHNKHLNNRLAWYAGYFYPTGGVGKYLGDQYRFTFRVSGLPIYNTTGRYTVLHLGLAYENQFQNKQELKLAERPEAHLAEKYVSLTIDSVNRADVFGGELSFVLGRFALQGEMMMARVNPVTSENANFELYTYSAYYINFSWFITGENRNYSAKKSAFDRITPKRNLGKGGTGAWELVLRFSNIDLNDQDLNGGAMTDFTAGLNWYLNPATKIRFNYIYSDVLDKGYANIAMVRFQVVF